MIIFVVITFFTLLNGTNPTIPFAVLIITSLIFTKSFYDNDNFKDQNLVESNFTDLKHIRFEDITKNDKSIDTSDLNNIS